MSAPREGAELPLSLYVHLPWCVRKCPYCDFNSYTAGDDPPRRPYVEALLRDIAAESARAGARPLVSVFIGGGTPSLFAPGEIAELLDAVAAHFTLGDDVEITMEANPGTIECGDPAGYRSAGVNRLSLGAQSFSPASLAALGRIHSVDDIGRAVSGARSAGFDNVNLDLMYGLPGQDVTAAMADIDEAVALVPEHLSWYQLTLEPNTQFHARPPAGMPDDDLAFEIQVEGQQRLADRGFEQYEVSAYARDGRRCEHNLNYWRYGDYVGVGAGAHGKLTSAGRVRRYAKPANPRQYMQAIANGDADAGIRDVPADERLFEFMLNVLRLGDGFSERLFAERTGLDAGELRRRLRGPADRGLLETAGGENWRVTALGRRFLNDLQAEFLPG